LNYSQSLFKSIFPSVYPETEKLKEVKCYLDEALEPEYVMPLEFLEINQKKYRNLSNMAKDLLCIPATSVPVECIFSQAGDLISKKRNRLSPETIQKVICLNSWVENSFLKD
jgi:hypothetical protein